MDNEIYLDHKDGESEVWRIRGLQGQYKSKAAAEHWLEVWKASSPWRGINQKDADAFNRNERKYRKAKGIQ